MPMAAEEEIRAEGRVSDEQEVLLYNIALRQEELGREPTNVLWDKVKDDPKYKELFDRELLTYQIYDHGVEGTPLVANLIITLKGIRYCIMYGDEIVPKRKWDAAGRARS